MVRQSALRHSSFPSVAQPASTTRPAINDISMRIAFLPGYRRIIIGLLLRNDVTWKTIKNDRESSVNKIRGVFSKIIDAYCLNSIHLNKYIEAITVLFFMRFLLLFFILFQKETYTCQIKRKNKIYRQKLVRLSSQHYWRSLACGAYMMDG